MKAIMRDEQEMKDSRIEWIEFIPVQWNYSPIKRVVTDRSGGAWGEDPQNINDIICMRIADFDFDRGYFADKDESLLTKRSYTDVQIQKLMLQYGDLLVEKSGGGETTPVGRAVLFNKEYNALFANFMDRLRFDMQTVCPLFVAYYWRAMYYKTVTTLYIKQTTGIQNLNITSLLEKECIFYPSLIEQQLIANYLDDRCSKIDAIIAEAKASIEEYKELKQSVIYEAVTKGLNKSEEMHITNNMWIPELPNNVKLSRLGLHYTVILGKMLCPQPRTSDDTLEPYICAANVHFDGISGDYKKMWFNCAEKKTYSVHCNDMLVVEGGAGAGGATIVDEEPLTQTFIQNSIMIVRAKDCDDNRYVKYLIEALVKRNYVDFVCNKATIPHFTKEKVSTIPYPVFSIEQRTKISDYLDDKTSKIDEIISEKQSLIEDLEAYKKSLIYEVVTGKRKVVE